MFRYYVESKGNYEGVGFNQVFYIYAKNPAQVKEILADYDLIVIDQTD